MSDIAIVSVAFGLQYIQQQRRLAASLGMCGGDVDFMFWEGVYPPGSKTMDESLYGFKVHAVKAALSAGYKKIMWLDTAMVCCGEVKYYFDKFHPVTAVKDDNLLENTISEKAVYYFGNPETAGWHLVGGSLYAFDFTQRECGEVFEVWERAEKDGMFGSVEEAVSEKINKHRHDESILAMALYLSGRFPVGSDIAKYNQEKNSLFIKKHFK